jgi:hypothetical protein
MAVGFAFENVCGVCHSHYGIRKSVRHCVKVQIQPNLGCLRMSGAGSTALCT